MNDLQFCLELMQHYFESILQDLIEVALIVLRHLMNVDYQYFEVLLRSLRLVEQTLFWLFRILKKLLAKSS